MRLEVKNVSVTYPRSILPPTAPHTAISDVSFTLEPGNIYALIGRNGAGKTSLLSALASFRATSSGAISVDGVPIFENGELMQHINFDYSREFSSEDADHYPKVGKYIKEQNEFRPDFDPAYAEELIQKFNLPTNKRPHKLSKGQQSVLQVIIGLSSRAKITIFDEAYIGMDAPTRDLFYKEVLRDQERHPRTIVMSTHLVSEMEYLFDEVLIVHDGKLIKEGSYDQIISQGATITGPSEAVDTFATGRQILNSETLGGFKKITLFSDLSGKDRNLAGELGLEIGSMSLQDLFIQLTGGNSHD
jgi:ABC-2 type transport system ATP-binding protein